MCIIDQMKETRKNSTPKTNETAIRLSKASIVVHPCRLLCARPGMAVVSHLFSSGIYSYVIGCNVTVALNV